MEPFLSIYEVNIRQYTSEGTFRAFESHLPRLKALGIDILWLMPVHPIGRMHRKGSLGSYYAVRDYRKVNPDYGTMEDFKHLVRESHRLGMRVLIDWVANHTAWDHVLTETHPNWYMKDDQGRFISPVPEWDDVIDLNYRMPGLRHYMTGALKYWVENTDIDGFRCDVAEMIPLEFWAGVREELERIKPVFMLAEGDDPECHRMGFDMTYDWELYNLLNKIATGQTHADAIWGLLDADGREYPQDAIRMRFTENHDKNSWEGTALERLDDGAFASAVLVMTIGGMPLIYSGQEAGLNKRLSFFEKDPIEWRDHPMNRIYSEILNLRKRNPALWDGARGVDPVRVHSSNDEDVICFIREWGEDKAFIVLNFSDAPVTISFSGTDFIGVYRDLFLGETTNLPRNTRLSLNPWGYRVFIEP